MLKRHSEVFRTTLMFTDVCLVAASWASAYLIRFHTVLSAPQGVPEANAYIEALVLIVPFWLWLLHSNGLYRLDRFQSARSVIRKIVRVSCIGVASLIGVTFFAYFNLSRTVVLLFSVLSISSLVSFRILIRTALSAARRRGYNLRHILLIGEGKLAREVIRRLSERSESGTRVFGVLCSDRSIQQICGIPILGDHTALPKVLQENNIEQVIIALPSREIELARKIANDLIDETVDVSLVPELLQTFRLRPSVEDLDGLAIISVREGPFVGWAAIQKRTFDLTLALVALGASAPLMAIIALLIRLTSKGPVIYIQERMGLDGRIFHMLKFRTMRLDAEEESGPVWTSREDSRRTKLGVFLRSTSLDELPQLWNVLMGDMSLVGPRPERPVFIAKFRREIPGYMQRHRVKAGLTGWAQVHGWRGNTSLHERIKHDIYYIENWSVGLDIRILFMTVWRGLFHRNAY